jgi:sugar transferase (PEP-CTERM/EpsH1 system associated)
VSVAGAAGAPRVVHLLYRFDTGGLENGVVNLINHLPAGRFAHVVVALTQVEPAFAARITAPGVEYVELHKRPGQTWWLYPQLHALFKRLRPQVLHTRNLSALECQVPAWAAGVPVRIHGEHGWDMADLGGANRRYRLLRRAYRPFVQRWVALSSQTERYLAGPIGVPTARLQRICNGVDAERFHPPAAQRREPIPGCPFSDPALWLAGTVGRMQPVKNPLGLAQAFVKVLNEAPEQRARLRLVMVGDGPERAAVQALLASAGVADLAWLPGERRDVPEVMRGLDCFVLPSLAEGISNTILEAMATGLPVLAAQVGGNADLVQHRGAQRTGVLVPEASPEALAEGLKGLAREPGLARQLGQAGRARVEREFSLAAMVGAYQGLYEQGLAQRAGVILPN